MKTLQEGSKKVKGILPYKEEACSQFFEEGAVYMQGLVAKYFENLSYFLFDNPIRTVVSKFVNFHRLTIFWIIVPPNFRRTNRKYLKLKLIKIANSLLVSGATLREDFKEISVLNT